MKLTTLDIMIRVAQLGLLRANKDELAKMEDYCDDNYGRDNYEITNHRIILLNDNPGVEYDELITEDVTNDVLWELYYERHWLSAKEAMYLLGCSRNTLCNYVKRGLIEHDENGRNYDFDDVMDIYELHQYGHKRIK